MTGFRFFYDIRIAVCRKERTKERKIMERISGTLEREKLTKAMNGCIEWIREFFEENGKGCNAVLGISGGKDSSVVAALLVEALGKDRVIGVLMPNGEQADIDMAHLLVDHLGIKYYVINIKDAVEGIKNAFPEDLKMSDQARINLSPRIRMSTVYAVSQSVNGRVANTCNLSEDWVGYSTRYGDSVGDFSPCSHFTVQEVKEIGRILGLPEALIEKAPSDGLCGKTDEDNLGFTYAVLDKYIRTGEIENEETKKLIDYKHKMNLFKLEVMPSYEPKWD
jgi:NAD+ synthase